MLFWIRTKGNCIGSHSNLRKIFWQYIGLLPTQDCEEIRRVLFCRCNRVYNSIKSWVIVMWHHVTPILTHRWFSRLLRIRKRNLKHRTDWIIITHLSSGMWTSRLCDHMGSLTYKSHRQDLIAYQGEKREERRKGWGGWSVTHYSPAVHVLLCWYYQLLS